MKYFFYLIIFIFLSPVAFSQKDSVLIKLHQTINQTLEYDEKKILAINKLRDAFLNTSEQNLQPRFAINEALYEEYKLFNYDSAYTYAGSLLNVAYRLNDKNLISEAKLKMSFILLSSGLFKEAYDSLTSINIYNSPDSLKANYYTQLGRYYYDLATYDLDKKYSVDYDKTGGAYMDSALLYYTPSSFDYQYYKGLKYLKQYKTDSSFVYFNKLMHEDLSYHQEALTASTLSNIFLLNGNADKAIELLATASIADVKGSIKETFAIQNLADLLGRKGNVAYASLFIEKALSNANEYGARQRKAQVSGILPLIENERIHATEAQNHLLLQYGTVVTILLITLIVLTLVIRRQVNKLTTAKRMITEAHTRQQEINKLLDDAIKKLEVANTKLEKTNMQLAFSNAKLEEANLIKEECVSYFFNLDSEFYSRLERLKSLLEKKIADKKLDEIKFIVNNIKLKEEKENLLQSFDKVFLRIYPNFIHSFNSFFKKEDQVHVTQGEMLTSDLRIFALIRMGITDNDKIARILGYSVNTIYTYKTKIKNKSLVPKESFETY